MGHYIRRRVLTAIPVFFGITLLVFFLFDLAPGSIADLMGEGAAARGPGGPGGRPRAGQAPARSAICSGWAACSGAIWASPSSTAGPWPSSSPSGWAPPCC